ncbi:hypothetical protein IAR50_002364 [Cryptococcus sp. DSM 104548]
MNLHPLFLLLLPLALAHPSPAVNPHRRLARSIAHADANRPVLARAGAAIDDATQSSIAADQAASASTAGASTSAAASGKSTSAAGAASTSAVASSSTASSAAASSSVVASSSTMSSAAVSSVVLSTTAALSSTAESSSVVPSTTSSAAATSTSSSVAASSTTPSTSSIVPSTTTSSSSSASASSSATPSTTTVAQSTTSAATSSSATRASSTTDHSTVVLVTTASRSSSSASSTATSANDSTDSSSSSGLSKGALVAIIVVASIVGLVIIGWTAFRKWKLRPSNRFGNKMQPIDFSPQNDNMDDDFFEKTLHRTASQSSTNRQRQELVAQLDDPNQVPGVPPHDFTAGAAVGAGVGAYGYHDDGYGHAEQYEYDQYAAAYPEHAGQGYPEHQGQFPEHEGYNGEGQAYGEAYGDGTAYGGEQAYGEYPHQEHAYPPQPSHAVPHGYDYPPTSPTGGLTSPLQVPGTAITTGGQEGYADLQRGPSIGSGSGHGHGQAGVARAMSPQGMYLQEQPMNAGEMQFPAEMQFPNPHDQQYGGLGRPTAGAGADGPYAQASAFRY